jgi:DNA-binding IclR family transcriptional regulator
MKSTSSIGSPMGMRVPSFASAGALSMMAWSRAAKAGFMVSQIALVAAIA